MSTLNINCVFIILVNLFIIGSKSARILAVFPVPSLSHQIIFRPITQELAKNHEVIVVTPDPAFPKDQSPVNLTEIDVHDVSYSQKAGWFKVNVGSKNYLTSQTVDILKLFSEIFEEQLKHESVQNLINDKTQKFDLIILEACVKPAIVYSHIFKAPVILVSSLGTAFDNYHVIGMPINPLRYPAALRIKQHNLTLWDKFIELYNFWRLQAAISVQEKLDNENLKKYIGYDMPTLTELSKNVQMLFLNVHEIWAGNYPKPPSVVYMAGIHQKPHQPLPKDLETLLNNSKRGVIYFSLGTNTKSSQISREKEAILINVFASLPYDVVWKYDNEKLPENHENIKTFKWLPQIDLLRHPNIKLFITQGGLQSTQEAIDAGVPLLGIPMTLDQWYNVDQIVHYNLGLSLTMETLTENDFKQAIETIIKNTSYRDNIRKFYTLVSDTPQKPLERVMWWIEHILRHAGGKHIRSPIANMPLTEFIELDVILTCITILLLLIMVFVIILKFIHRKCKLYSKRKVS